MGPVLEFSHVSEPGRCEEQHQPFMGLVFAARLMPFVDFAHRQTLFGLGEAKAVYIAFAALAMSGASGALVDN